MSDFGLFSDNATLAAKDAMRLDAKASGFTRLELCDRLKAHGVNITESALEAFLSDSNRNRFPAAWVRAWVESTDQRRLYHLTLDEADARMIKFGRTFVEAMRIAGGAA